MKRWKVFIGVVLGVLLLALGLFTLNGKNYSKAPTNTNQTTSTTKTQSTIIDPNAAKFEGEVNLKKYEDVAQKNASRPKDQVNAAVSAYVNQDFNKAIEYYKKALVLQPKNGQYLTYLGNVYFRGLNDPKTASQYYQAATQADPRYVYGWWNLALSEKALGDKDAAKATLKKGITCVDPSDPMAKQLQLQLNDIK